MRKALCAGRLGAGLLAAGLVAIASLAWADGADLGHGMIVKVANPALRLFHEDGSPAPDAKLPALPTPILDSAGGRYKVRGADAQVYIVRPLDVIVTGVCDKAPPPSGGMATRDPGHVVAGVAAGAGKGC